jgi:protein-disulfide isomerase
MSDPIEDDQTLTSPLEGSPSRHEASVSPQARRARRARLAQLFVVATVVVVATIVVAIATGAGGGSAPSSSGPRASEVERGISSLLAGISQHANVLGRSEAPVTLRWFGDLECPFCKRFALGALPSIIGQWVRSGSLKIEYFSMETATRDLKVFSSQEVAALAAGIQDRLWNYIETFYHEQGEEGSGYVTDKYLEGLARQVPGLNRVVWAEDRYDPKLAARVAAEMRVAQEAGFTGTPSFLISRRGGRVIRLSPPSLTDPKPFDVAIEYLLDRSARAIPARFVPADLSKPS